MNTQFNENLSLFEPLNFRTVKNKSICSLRTVTIQWKRGEMNECLNSITTMVIIQTLFISLLNLPLFFCFCHFQIISHEDRMENRFDWLNVIYSFQTRLATKKRLITRSTVMVSFSGGKQGFPNIKAIK